MEQIIQRTVPSSLISLCGRLHLHVYCHISREIEISQETRLFLFSYPSPSIIFPFFLSFFLQIFFAIPELGALESCNIAESPYLDRSDTQRYPVLACHIRTLFLGLELHRCLWVRSKWDLFFFLYIYWLWHHKIKLLADILPTATIVQWISFLAQGLYPHFFFDGYMTRLHLNFILVTEIILHAPSVYNVHRLSFRADRGSSLLASANFVSGWYWIPVITPVGVYG